MVPGLSRTEVRSDEVRRSVKGGPELEMTYATQMLRTHPQQKTTAIDPLARCIDACFDCAETCTACADACLGEDMVKELVTCIRLNADCADVCETTGKLMTRHTGGVNVDVLRRTLEACVAACRACAVECEKHASKHEHCRVCAEACRTCEQACVAVIQSFGK